MSGNDLLPPENNDQNDQVEYPIVPAQQAIEPYHPSTTSIVPAEKRELDFYDPNQDAVDGEYRFLDKQQAISSLNTAALPGPVEATPKYVNPLTRPRSPEAERQTRDPRSQVIEDVITSKARNRRDFLKFLGGAMVAAGALGATGLAAKYILNETGDNPENAGKTVNEMLGLPNDLALDRLPESPIWYDYTRPVKDPSTGQEIDAYEVLSMDGQTVYKTEPGIMVNGRTYYKFNGPDNIPYYMVLDPDSGVLFARITKLKE